MITIRKSEDRGHASLGWLDTYHTFSFNTYHDPNHMGFRTLRVMNDDRIEPGEGFGTHPHRDMEIITYVLDGELKHKDSMGQSGILQAGDVQHMSAGTGVLHSEYNPSEDQRLHLLQIWIFPEKKNLEPSYGQKTFGPEEKKGKLCLIVSPDGADGSLVIRQDAKIYATLLGDGEEVSVPIEKDRHIWVQVAHGAASLNGEELSQGDGAAMSDESELKLTGRDHAEVLIFDLA